MPPMPKLSIPAFKRCLCDHLVSPNDMLRNNIIGKALNANLPPCASPTQESLLLELCLVIPGPLSPHREIIEFVGVTSAFPGGMATRRSQGIVSLPGDPEVRAERGKKGKNAMVEGDVWGLSFPPSSSTSPSMALHVPQLPLDFGVCGLTC